MARRGDREGLNAYNRVWYRKNLERCRAQRNDWKRRNPIKRREANRKSYLKRKFGITPEIWDAIFGLQGCTCAICGHTEPRGGRWALDHDHETGRIRGILCMLCNTAIGKMGDSPELLGRAIEYLRRYAKERK